MYTLHINALNSCFLYFFVNDKIIKPHYDFYVNQIASYYQEATLNMHNQNQLSLKNST